MRVTKSLEQLYSVPLPNYLRFRKIVLAVPNYPACPELPRLTVHTLTSNKRIPRLLTCVRKVKHSKNEVIAVNDFKMRLDVASKIRTDRLLLRTSLRPLMQMICGFLHWPRKNLSFPPVLYSSRWNPQHFSKMSLTTTLMFIRYTTGAIFFERGWFWYEQCIPKKRIQETRTLLNTLPSKNELFQMRTAA